MLNGPLCDQEIEVHRGAGAGVTNCGARFWWVPGIDPDIASAVTHAREAAQRGSFDAIREIGPQLQASQIGPDEVAAWNLVYAALEQQGCAGQAINTELVKSVSSTLNPLTISANAKALAEKYWQHYGTQMMSNFGCTS